MKLNSLTLLAFLLAASPSALAADLFWDGGTTDILVDGNGASAGGTGTWDTTILNWDAGVSPHVAWNNGNNDTAIFGGTAGTVTLGTNITAAGLEFSSGGYILEGGGNTITLGNDGGVRSSNSPGPSLWTSTGTTTINANINNNGFLFTTVGSGSAIINGVISGSGGFSTYNNSDVTLAGNNTYTGKTSITSDTTSGSTLRVSSLNSVVGGTASSSLGAPTTVADGTILIGAGGKKASGCTLVYTGAGETTDRVINIAFNGGGSRVIDSSGSGKLTFSSAMTTGGTNQNGALILQGSGDGEFLEGLPQLGNNGLQKEGTGTWTLSGANTYTRDTLVSNGTLILGASSEMLFSIAAAGMNNSLLGDATNANLTLDGALVFDLTGASTTISDSWNIVDVANLTETYGGTFSVKSTLGNFSDVDGNLWTLAENGVLYEFEEATGVLTVGVIPEPSVAIIGSIGLLMLLRRRR